MDEYTDRHTEKVMQKEMLINEKRNCHQNRDTRGEIHLWALYVANTLQKL